MKTLPWIGSFAALLALAGSTAAQLPPLRPPPAAEEPPSAPVTIPQVGEKAPDFTLPDKSGIPVALSELLRAAEKDGPSGREPWVLLVFYRGYWCPACNADLRSLQDHFEEFTARGIQIVAISVDPPDVTRRHVEKRGYSFLFLSDTQTHVTRSYALLREGKGDRRADVAHPGQFLIDSTGTIRWANLIKDHQVRVHPEQLLEVFDALTPAPDSVPTPP